jgi:hypothetical protein
MTLNGRFGVRSALYEWEKSSLSGFSVFNPQILNSNDPNKFNNVK